MPAFRRLNNDTFYVNGVPIPASYFQALDTAQSESVNGDLGGTYNPTGPIVMAGAGVWLASPWTSVTGVSVNTGIATHGTKVDFQDNDAPLLSPGHVMSTRTIIQSPGAEWGDASGGSGSWVSPGYANGDLMGAIGPTPRAIIPLEVHNLGTLTEVTLTILPSPQHTQVPQVLPQMRVYAVDVFGDVIVLGAVGGAGYQALEAPASVSAYAGVTQYLVYPIVPDAVIDKSAFTYLLEIVDESGSGAVYSNPNPFVGTPQGNRYQQISTVITNIPAIYFP